MKRYFENLAKALFGLPFGDLDAHQQEIIQHIARGTPIAANVNDSFHEQLSFGQKMADRISAFGGSWTFIILFMCILIGWIIMNTLLLVSPREPFDPYPYILLNLVLSTLAALQAPIIMMAQNRQTAKDRLEIAENYKVSLKTDLEILRLHEKIDYLTAQLESKQPR